MAEPATMTRLLMNRSRFDDMRIDTVDLPSASPGEVVLALDRFALTVNNVTYAAFGDALRYWDFFPSSVDGYGLLPVWGYADVVDSKVEGIAPGQRYYGYFPAATHLVVRPGKGGARSFRDEAPHRRALPEVYNWYQRTDDDPFHTEASEPLHAIFRPLFVTAFGLVDFLAEHDFFGAECAVISSASSRTGYAVAFGIGLTSVLEIVGLTSASHRGFVEGLRLYDQVLGYDDLEQLPKARPTLYIDVAGNAEVQLRIHRHFGDRLVHDAALGAAHAHAPPQPDPNLPGPAPQFFFAPNWVAQRQAEWGASEFDRRVGQATARFYDQVTRNRLIELREQRGLDAARDILGEMLAGHTDPAIGHIVRLRGG